MSNNKEIQGILKNVSFSPNLSVYPANEDRSSSSMSNNWEYSNNNNNYNWEYSNNNNNYNWEYSNNYNNNWSSNNNYDNYVNYGTNSNWSSSSIDNNWDRNDYVRVASPAPSIHSRSASPAVSIRAQSPTPFRSISRSSSPAFSIVRSNQDSSSYNYDSGNQYNYNDDIRYSQAQNYASQIEQAMINSATPININERETITVNGISGIYANKAEAINWRGPIPIDQYQINSDANAQVINKRFQDKVVQHQEIQYRLLKPPNPPPAGDIIIQQESDIQAPAAPPLVIRQEAPRPRQPDPIVIREEPPRAPAPLPPKTITIKGKTLPPPPRKLIIEKLPQLPAPPPNVIIERWLGYPERTRNVIFKSGRRAAPLPPPRNVIIQWDSPEVDVKQKLVFLGVENADPASYASRYNNSLTNSNRLPEVVNRFNDKIPQGEVLAINQRHTLPRLVGDLQALSLIDLDRHGLGEYRNQIGSYSNTRLRQSYSNIYDGNDYNYRSSSNRINYSYDDSNNQYDYNYRYETRPRRASIAYDYQYEPNYYINDYNDYSTVRKDLEYTTEIVNPESLRIPYNSSSNSNYSRYSYSSY